MATILIVDDEADIRSSVKLCLRSGGHTIVEAADGRDALEKAASIKPDLVLLDYMMPELDGIGALTALRATVHGRLTPVIMLTALSDDMTIVRCYEAGADSYITKPFKFVHLEMQVKALLARAQQSSGVPDNNILVYHNIVMRPNEHKLEVDGKSVELTPKEYDLLKYFLMNINRLLSRDDILDNVWGYDFDETRTVDYHLSKLREKLFGCPQFAQSLKNVRGRGYRLEPAE